MRFVALVIALLSTAACGRFDFHAVPDAPTKMADASIDVPADAALPVCAGCMLASSEADFTNVQGANGWYYGYWWGSIDPDGVYDAATDFREMANPMGNWNPPDYNPDPQSPDFTWAYLQWWGGHPGATPAVKLPIRRWVSNVTGLASLTVHHAKSDPTGGDGTRLSILADGQLLWTHDVAGTDGIGVTEEVPVVLKVGTKIDMVLDFITNDAIDTTAYSMIVHGP